MPEIPLRRRTLTGMRIGTRGATLIAGAVIAIVVVLVLLARPPGGASLATGQPSVAASAGSRTDSPPSPTAATVAPPTSDPTAQGTAAPQPTTEGPTVTLVGTGDIADCNSDVDTQTAALVAEVPGTVITMGDNAYEDGTRAEFDACYQPTWGQFKGRTRPAPGNHEYHTPGAAGYFGYFGDRAGPDGRGYYAYTRGAWRIYSLNSQCGEIGGCDPASPQLRWLLDDLEANPSRCSLAYWHHPRYSSGEHGSQAVMDPIWDALVDARVEIVLAGHDHSYERFAPMDKAGDLAPERGITSFVVGTGGREFYEFEEILSTSRARVSGVAGVIELTLRPESWSSRFVAVPGSDFTDNAQDVCH